MVMGAALKALPVLILITDGDCWKLQTLFEVHVDVDVLRMSEKVSHFSYNEIREESDRCEDDQ